MDIGTLIVWFVVGLVVLAALTVGAVILFDGIWNPKSPEHRELVDETNTQRKALTASEMTLKTQGNFVFLGIDESIGQNYPLSEGERTTNFINVGPVRSGKSAFFLNMYEQDIAKKGNTVVIFDPQEDTTPLIMALCQKYQRDFIIFPDVGFNPLDGPGGNGRNGAKMRARLFADLYGEVAEIGTSDNARYFLNQAKLFITKVIPLFERAYGKRMILRELLFLCSSEDMRKKLLTKAGQCAEAAEYKTLIADNWEEEDYKKKLDDLVAFLERLMEGPQEELLNRRDALTLGDCINTPGKVIIIRGGGARDSSKRELGLLFMVSLQKFIDLRPDVDSPSPPHFMSLYIDEAHYYLNREFRTCIATSRKKNIAIHLGFQSFEQLQPFLNTILTNARTWVVHGGLLEADAKIVAENVGERLFLSSSHSQQVGGDASVTRTPVYEHMIRSYQIRNLDKDHALVLSIEEREVSPPAIIKKFAPPKQRSLYQSPQTSAYPSPTIWEEEALQAGVIPQNVQSRQNQGNATNW